MTNLFYLFLKQYCRVALKFYFSKWQVNGVENIPGGPVIFVPNHQNAFLDAILVTCSSSKKPWFLTRAEVFKNPKAKWILTKLKMLPVYRFRDGYTTLKQNDEVLIECIRKLNSDESLLIFAEGNHGAKLQLRPLQKGVARIAFEVSSPKNLAIIPVGIQYESSGDFRSRVLVNFGKPVFADEFKSIDVSIRNSQELFLDLIKTQLQNLMLHIDDENYDEKLKYLRENRIFTENLVEQLQNDKHILSKFTHQKLVSNKVENSFTSSNFLQNYVHINLFLPSLIIQRLLLSRIHDPQFNRSVKFSAGQFVVPLFLVLQGYILLLLSASAILSALYVLSVIAAVYYLNRGK